MNRARFSAPETVDALLTSLPRRGSQHWTGVIVGGRGAFRRFASFVAPLVGDAVFDAGEPAETADRVNEVARAYLMPRVVIFAPDPMALPIATECEARGIVVHVSLRGVKPRAREVFLRRAITALRASLLVVTLAMLVGCRYWPLPFVTTDAGEPDAGAAPACVSTPENVSICLAHAAPPDWAVPYGCMGPVEADGGTREAGLAGCWRVDDYPEDGGPELASLWCCPE